MVSENGSGSRLEAAAVGFSTARTTAVEPLIAGSVLLTAPDNREPVCLSRSARVCRSGRDGNSGGSARPVVSNRLRLTAA